MRLNSQIVGVYPEMKLLISLEELEQAGCRDLIPFECDNCHQAASRTKNRIKASLKHRSDKGMYCSLSCTSTRGRVMQQFACAQCGQEVKKHPSAIARSKKRGLVNHFCSSQCAGTYTAAHKQSGTRRSKLECWLEEQLTVYYLSLHIDYNQTSAIQAELDIYIPSLKLAFELNGIFHYEPIFGDKKLGQTQNKDRYKLHACTAAGIDLCVLDISGTRYFKPKSSQRYLDIITKVVNERMATPTGAAPA